MKLLVAPKLLQTAARLIGRLRLSRRPFVKDSVIRMNERFDQRMQERRANPTHIYHGLHQTHLQAGEADPKRAVTPLNMHKRFIKKFQERRAKKWTRWRDAYEAEKRTNDWPVWSASQLEKLSRTEREIEEAYRQRVRDAEYAALLERQAKERAELAAELDRTRSARAWTLTFKELLENAPYPIPEKNKPRSQ